MYSLETPEELEKGVRYIEQERTYTNEIENLALRCLKKAQERKDLDLEYRVRVALISIHNGIHKPDLVISMFPWLLKMSEENRDRFDYRQILWYYRWIITIAKQYASVPKAKLTELLTDFERRYRDEGAGMKIVHESKFGFYSESGELELAEKELELHRSATFSIFVGCIDCRKLFPKTYLIDRGRYEEVLELLNPVLHQQVTCHLNERYGYHIAMLATMMLGKWDEAEIYAVRSSCEMDLTIGMLYVASSHLIYHGITGQFSVGRDVFEKQFPFVLKPVSDLPKLEFLIGAQVYFTRLLRSGRTTIQLSVPEHPELHPENGVYKVDALLQFIEKEINRIATAFDNRNENDYYKGFVADMAHRYDEVEQSQNGTSKG